MKQIALFFLLTFYCLINTLNAQNALIKGRITVKASYSKYRPMFLNGAKPGNWRMEINYGLMKYLETGIYIGYSRFYALSLHQVASGSNIGRTNSPFYGININIHLLPLLIKKDDFRFDLYLLGKFGGNYYFTNADYFPERGHRTEYGFGVGISFYLWKHTGIYAEYSRGKYSYYDYPPGTFENTLQANFRFGITYKFKYLRP
ncbi:MAG: outer membrane beta-barrel protein [Paludibacter sp.]